MTDHEKDNVQEKKCDKNLSFIDMLLIMMILYFFYDLILIEKVKEVTIETPKVENKNVLVKIIDNLPKLKMKAPKISLPKNIR